MPIPPALQPLAVNVALVFLAALTLLVIVAWLDYRAGRFSGPVTAPKLGEKARKDCGQEFGR